MYNGNIFLLFAAVIFSSFGNNAEGITAHTVQDLFWFPHMLPQCCMCDNKSTTHLIVCLYSAEHVT